MIFRIFEMKLWQTWIMIAAMIVVEGKHWSVCSSGADAMLPCMDQYTVHENETTFTTFYGHECYSFDILSSDSTMDVYFIDKLVYDAHFRGMSLDSIQSLCQSEKKCEKQRDRLFQHSEYLLLIRPSPHTTATSTVVLRVESCDPYSFFETVLLVSVFAIGFCLAAGLVCSFVEYLFGYDFLAIKKQPRNRHDFQQEEFELLGVEEI